MHRGRGRQQGAAAEEEEEERTGMKLALMDGEVVPRAELRELGFEAVQMFFGHGAAGAADDPPPAAIDRILQAGRTALAAMTLHVRLLAGSDTHHIVEAVFKGVARALGEACARHGLDEAVPSTKGTL